MCVGEIAVAVAGLLKTKVEESNSIKGFSILPYRLFLSDKGLIKMEIVLGRGKKLYDKRETIKKRDIDRDIKRGI